jgi:hypothetical protein
MEKIDYKVYHCWSKDEDFGDDGMDIEARSAVQAAERYANWLYFNVERFDEIDIMVQYGTDEPRTIIVDAEVDVEFCGVDMTKE